MTKNDNSWSREDDSWRKTTSHGRGRQAQIVCLEVVSKPYLMSDSPRRRIAGLFKMRIRQNVWRTAPC